MLLSPGVDVVVRKDVLRPDLEHGRRVYLVGLVREAWHPLLDGFILEPSERPDVELPEVVLRGRLHVLWLQYDANVHLNLNFLFKIITFELFLPIGLNLEKFVTDENFLVTYECTFFICLSCH